MPQEYGLEEALGPDFNGTVFAPTDDAFDSLFATAKELNITLTDDEVLTTLVRLLLCARVHRQRKLCPWRCCVRGLRHACRSAAGLEHPMHAAVRATTSVLSTHALPVAPCRPTTSAPPS